MSGWKTTLRSQEIVCEVIWTIFSTCIAAFANILKEKAFQGEYGVHCNSMTAYQCCHELQYEQFGSDVDFATVLAYGCTETY